VALHDARRQLFDATERILLRRGPSALTSRAVTAEALVAKGVLHRHFADFDAFLAEFVLDRAERMDPQAAALREAAGAGTVAGNLAGALTALFGSVAVAIVALVDFRDELRARLRRDWPAGVPVLTEAMVMIASYLAAERDLGRIAADADIDTLSAVLIGAGHRLFADRQGNPREAVADPQEAVATMVTTVLAAVTREPGDAGPLSLMNQTKESHESRGGRGLSDSSGAGPDCASNCSASTQASTRS
jgi:AcrR family transcriptional regulator